MVDADTSDVLLNAYDCVLDPGRWRVALDALTRSLGARGTVLVLQEKDGTFEGFSEGCSYYADRPDGLFERYKREQAHREASAWQVIETLRPGEMFLDTQVGIPVEELDAQPHYRFGREHLNIRRRMAFRVNGNPAWFDAFAAAYDAELDAVPGHVAARVAALSPHLGKAIEMSRAFAQLRQRYNAVLSSLDRLGVGIAIALPSGEVVVSNAQADRLLETDDTIRLGADRRPACRHAHVADEIRDRIARAARTAAGTEEALSTPLQLDRRGDRAPLILDIAPLRDSSSEIEKNLNGAILFLIDMDHPPVLDVPRFCRLHKLSKAETEVCVLMARGDSTTTIAEKRNTSPHTIHNQIKAVFAKTGCNSRGTLLHLIVRTLPPIL